MTPAAPDVHALARDAHRAGLCVLPPKQDGSKQPDATTWTCYQRERSTLDQITDWYADVRRTGLGLVTGAVSGHLELFEFDDAEIYERFLALAEDAGLGDLVRRIAAGYTERTPGLGIHWLYFLLGGGTKATALACRPGVDKHGNPRADPLIETKGEGGYVVVAPSSGGVHPTGRAYERISGGFDQIATITHEERDALWALARSLDEMPSSPAKERQPKSDGTWRLRPGDDFNARTTWPEILEPLGWVAVREQDEATYWRRPGGFEGGWGASTNFGGTDLLHVWTTAAPPLKPDTSITKFTAYALLSHDGDFTAAAAALAEQGYGERNVDETDADAAPVVLVPVPVFPLNTLPPIARSFVVAGARALGCPPDFVVLPLFGFVAAVAGNSRKLRIKRGFEVPLVFWLGVVGKPGTVKTPALNLSRKLLDVLQKETWDTYERDYEEWFAAKPSERGPKPHPEHFFATDTTTEAVAFALQSSRGIAIIHDELAGWVLAFDNYKKGGDRQAWLSSWSAAPLKPNRKTGEPIYIPEPVVCVVGGIQPDVLPDLAGEAARDDGFVPRLLLAWPDAEPSPWTDETLDDAVFADMLAVIRPLRLKGDDVAVTALSPEAYTEWVTWFNENQRLVGRSRGLTAGWGAKAPVHLARIALVLHLLAHPRDRDRPLSAVTLRDAIEVVEYFRAHLGRILPAFGAAPPAGGVGLAARVRRVLDAEPSDWVARSTIAERLGGHVPADELTAVLEAMRTQHQAVCRTTATTGRAREEWRLTAGPGEKPTCVKTGKDGKRGSAPPAGGLIPSFPVFPQTPLAGDDEAEEAWETWQEGL